MTPRRLGGRGFSCSPCIVLGGMMAADMGGPVNNATAYLVQVRLFLSGKLFLQVVPAAGSSYGYEWCCHFSHLCRNSSFKDKFTAEECNLVWQTSSWASFITEGADLLCHWPAQWFRSSWFSSSRWPSLVLTRINSWRHGGIFRYCPIKCSLPCFCLGRRT